MTKGPRNSIVLPILAAMLVSPTVARSHGALAIGVTQSVTEHGIAIGFAWNASTGEGARVDAMKSCLDFKGASVTARAHCAVVSTFSRQCFSIAIDQPGGAGWGWAVEPVLADAERNALRSCKSTVSGSCLIHFDTTVPR